eukprot:GHVR01105404.1.p2 GENE.GHVR01105404.1~~GHVR01105404.1.p2  ORF type:complete len:121 (-),score=17.32 GHVR01105404.1:223-585(-)
MNSSLKFFGGRLSVSIRKSARGVFCKMCMNTLMMSPWQTFVYNDATSGVKINVSAWMCVCSRCLITSSACCNVLVDFNSIGLSRCAIYTNTTNTPIPFPPFRPPGFPPQHPAVIRAFNVK